VRSATARSPAGVGSAISSSRSTSNPNSRMLRIACAPVSISLVSSALLTSFSKSPAVERCSGYSSAPSPPKSRFGASCRPILVRAGLRWLTPSILCRVPAKSLVRAKASLLLLLVVAVALSASPVASAKPGYFAFPAERSSQLTVKGTHGFRITIARHGRRVELNASNGSTAAIYVVRTAKNPAEQIQATFPGLGRVSVHFRPAGRTQRGLAVCRGRAPIRQDGIFRGVVKFEGEHEFTRIDVENAKGSTYRSFKEICKMPSDTGSETPPNYWLTESARSHGRAIVFAATESVDDWGLGRSAVFFAAQRERRHGMLSVRVASVQADADAFALSGPPMRRDSVTITPPVPFSGTASFLAPPGAPAKWEGTLAVELPGAGTVPLTGPQFTPELCRGQRCVGGPRSGNAGT
jgi:hypothetical protein